MKTYTIPASADGKKLSRYLTQTFPKINNALQMSFFRKKCFKINGVHAKQDTVLHTGDELIVYVQDELLETVERKKEDKLLAGFHVHLNIVYEDGNILVADKKPGIPVHPDEKEKVNTLLTHVRAYLYQKGEYDSTAEGAFSPAAANRIDRFTSGLVMFAKNAPAMHALTAAIREHTIIKKYLAVTASYPSRDSGTLINYLYPPDAHNRVSVVNRFEPGTKKAITEYRVLDRSGYLCLLECTLVTGRTHQIRAQLAHIGCPILGDETYGSKKANEKADCHFQALYAFSETFDFPADSPLSYLNGKSIRASDVSPIRRWFKNINLNTIGEKE